MRKFKHGHKKHIKKGKADYKYYICPKCRSKFTSYQEPVCKHCNVNCELVADFNRRIKNMKVIEFKKKVNMNKNTKQLSITLPKKLIKRKWKIIPNNIKVTLKIC